MKSIQSFLLLAAAGLAVLLGFHFLTSSSVDHRLDQQGEKLDHISKQAELQEKDLGDQKKLLGVARERVADHSARLEALEKRVTAAEASILEKEKAIEALAATSGKDHEKLSKLEAELINLRQDHDQSLRELHELRKEGRARDEDLDRRLKELERRAKVVPPSP